MTKKEPCKLTISNLSLSVRIGCHKHEKIANQLVSVTIEISLKEPPIGIESDRLEDTFCYSELAKALEEFVNGKSFDLVEKFTKDLHICICKFLNNEGYGTAIVAVTTHKRLSKTSPIKGGILFRYGE